MNTIKINSGIYDIFTLNDGNVIEEDLQFSSEQDAAIYFFGNYNTDTHTMCYSYHAPDGLSGGSEFFLGNVN